MPYFKFKLTDTKSNPFHRLTRKKLIFTIHISLFKTFVCTVSEVAAMGNNTENATSELKSTW